MLQRPLSSLQQVWQSVGKVLSLAVIGVASAQAALNVTPITWNVVGLDSNAPMAGPYQFPVGARVCAAGSASNGPVTASFEFLPFTPLPSGSTNGDTACSGGACITLRTGTLSSINLGTIAAGTCQDAYFEVEVLRVMAAYGTARRYVVRANDADPGDVTTPQPRELFVERLISQNRNSVQSVSYSAPVALNSTFPSAGLTPVNAGGSFGLAVGNFYDIRLDASTATQGYEQLETFANFSNAVFRIHRVQSTYSADTSPNVASPSDLLYGDGCTWQLSPALPNYLGCLATGKVGGTISTTYRVEILQVAGGTTSALNTLIYDYSGSSFHYNADVGLGGRTIIISNPSTAVFSKAFQPASIPENGISRLTLSIANPNLSSFSGYNFIDPLPGGIVVSATPNAATSNCGSPTFSPSAGATSLSFSNGTIAGNSTCTISVDVTGANSGAYLNTTNNLFVDTTDTGLIATATLTISDVPPPPSSGTCTSGVVETLARWDMSNNATGALASPFGPAPPVTDNVIGTPVARAFGVDANAEAQVSSTGFTNNSWLVGGNNTGVPFWARVLPAEPVAIGTRYLEVELNTSEHINIDLTYRVNYLANGDWGSNNTQSSRVYSTFDGGSYGTTPIRTDATFNKNTWNTPVAYRAPTSGLTSTRFGMVFGGNGNGAGEDDADVLLDDIVITGCRVLRGLTVTKSFAPAVIGVGQTSTLTFVINNPNTAPASITGVTLTDPMPSGLTIGALNNVSCGGTLAQSPAGTISLTGGSIAASSSCSFTAVVTGTTAGLKENVSDPISSTQTGTNTSASGVARADLRVVAPPVISKNFTPDPIVAGGTTGLSFTISNPNTGVSLVSVGFTDTFPTSPGAMVVATPPSAVNGCGSGTWSPSAGAGSVTLSGVTLAAGASCSVSVLVTAPTAGSYNNTSGPVSHVLNSATLNGNTANDTLQVNTPQPRIGLQKRISLSPTGPWGEFVSLGLNGNVYYQFTFENLGDVPLSRPASGFWITDPQIPGSPFCGAGSPASLPVANISDTHIYECVVGPIVANQQNLTNTATVTGDPDTPALQDGDEVTDTDTASYTTKLPDLVVTKTRVLPVSQFIDFTVVNDISYRVTVQNLGPPSTVNDTLAPIVVEDTLRAGISYLSFSSSNPAWSCLLTQTAPDKVVCTFSAALPAGTSTTFDLNVRVAINTPDINNVAVALNGGDPACNDPNPLPDTDCKGPYLEQTVPVTLSDVLASVQNGELVVNFGTAFEAGTLGFRVLTDNRVGVTPRALREELTLPSASSVGPQRYQIRGPYRGEAAIWIEETASNGAREVFGPYAIGQQHGDAQLKVAIDWSAIGEEQRRFRASRTQLLSVRSGADVQAEIKVNQNAWVTVTYEALLAQGIDWTGLASKAVTLEQGATVRPLQTKGPAMIGPGSSFSFLAEAVEGSLYTMHNVYRLRANGATTTLLSRFAGPGNVSAQGSVRARFEHAPNRGYYIGAPSADPWWARRVVRSNTASASASEEFVLSAKAEGVERLEVVLWGGLDYPTGPDHSVRLKLNGEVVASARFDGVVRQVIEVTPPAGLLRTGSNTLELELLADTGLTNDVVYLDAIAVDYQRVLKAAGNRLMFEGSSSASASSGDDESLFRDDFSVDGMAACRSSDSACLAYRVEGLSSSDVVVLQQSSNGSVRRLAGTRLRTEGSGVSLTFAARETAGDRYFIEPSSGATSELMAAAAVSNPLESLGAAQLLLISHPSFIDRLAPLVNARRAEGLSVGVLDVEQIYRYFNKGVVDPAAIQAAIAEAQRSAGTRYVLLVGGDSYDYLNHLGNGSQSFIPTHYRNTSRFISFAPVDTPYGDVDGDGRVDVAVGRFPVRTAVELDTLIAKTLGYAQAPHAARYLRVSDRDQGSINFDGQSQTIGTMLGTSWVNSSVALRQFASGSTGMLAARSALAAAVNSGQSLVTFFGHSSPSSWSRESLLTAPVVYGGLFSNSQAPTVVWQLGCYGAYFVDPIQNTVSHALMLQSNGGGAAAVLGASGLTEVSSDLAWMSALTPALKVERIGDAWLAAQRSLAQQGAPLRDISLGAVLLGDPTLKIRQ